MGGSILVLAASSLWVGILLEGLGHRGPTGGMSVALLALGAAAIGAAVWARAAPRWRVVAGIGLAFVLLGAGWAGLREASVRASPLTGLLGRSVLLNGSLGSDPEAGPFGWTASLGLGTVLDGPPGSGRAFAVHESVWLEGRGAPLPLAAGDRVEATGLLEWPRGDFGDYLRHRGFAGTFLEGTVRRVGPPSSPMLRFADAMRTALRTSIGRVLPPKEGGLLLGLALGDTSRLDPGVDEDFRATGLSHLTAVSGENVAMFLAPILGIVTWLGLSRMARLCMGVAAIGFFVLLTRAEPSVLRAAMMAGLTMLGVFVGRPRSAPAIIGGAVLLLLALNPTLVYAIGFQLSVAATAGMALLSGPVAERLRWLPTGLALAGATTIGAQAGVTPLLLYHFGVVPTVTLPANLLAFLAVGPGMLLGLAGAALGLVARPLGLVVAGAGRIPLAYLEGLADRLARSPLPSVTSPGGQLPVLIAEAAVVGGLAWWIRTRRRMPRRLAVASALVLPVMLWAHALAAGPPPSLTVTFFSVGWGDSSLVRSPGGATVLIDGGPDAEQVATKLAAMGIRRLDMVVATHPHADHIDGLPAVLDRFPTALVIDPGCRSPTPYYDDFLRAVASAGIPFHHPRPGQTIRVGDLSFQVLAPEHCFHATHSDPNNDSLVLRLTCRGHVVLFGGDAEQPSQSELVNDRPALLAAALWKWPHHGGNTNLDAFFAATRARVAIVSTGPNIYGDPSPVVLAKLARAGIRVYRTDYAGDLTTKFGAGGLTIQSGGG